MTSRSSRDLRSRYASDYRIVGARSGKEAIDTLRALNLQDDAVALLLVDQRMPQITGIDVLRESMKLFPAAKKALLTAYADTEAAIRAINEVGLDHYIMKPWDPPEEALYPILDDLLDDWAAGYRPTFEGIRVIGQHWSRETHGPDRIVEHVADWRPFSYITLEYDIKGVPSQLPLTYELEPYEEGTRLSPATETRETASGLPSASR